MVGNLKLRIALLEAGIKQKELELLSGVAQPVISQIITGRIIPTTDEKIRIAKALNKKIEELFS